MVDEAEETTITTIRRRCVVYASHYVRGGKLPELVLGSGASILEYHVLVVSHCFEW